MINKIYQILKIILIVNLSLTKELCAIISLSKKIKIVFLKIFVLIVTMIVSSLLNIFICPT